MSRAKQPPKVLTQYNPRTEALLVRYETLMKNIEAAKDLGSHRDTLLLTLERDKVQRTIADLYERGEL